MTVATRAHLRYREFEGVNSVSVLLHQRPRYTLIEGLNGCLGFLGDMSHDRVNHFTFVVPLLTLHDILGANPALRKIDIS